MSELFTYVLLPLAALILALLAIGGTVLVTGMAVRWRGMAFAAVMGMLTLASILTIVLSQRHLTLSVQGLVDSSDGTGGGIVSKLLLMAAVGASLALCLAWLFDLNKRLRACPRYTSRGMLPPTDMLVAFMLFYVAFSLLPIPLGQHYYFHISLVYPFFVYLALFLYIQSSTVDPALVAKHCLGMIVFASAAAAVVTPSAAFQPGYVGLLPGFNLRLWGVAAHANSLGSVAAAYILLEQAVPSKRRAVKLLVFSVATAVLLMTQSKTSIATALFGTLVISGSRIWAYVSDKGRGYNHSGGLFIASLLAMACVAVVLLGAWTMFFDTNVLRSLERHLDSRAVGDLSSGTGRLWIWSAAIHGGMENPLFGQGADFWSLENRLRLGLSGAVTAHNLYLQVFSRSGFVGLAALLGFLYVLIRYAVRGAKATGGASVAMLLVLLVRSVPEVPIAPNAILGAEFFATMAFIFFILDRGARPAPLAAPRAEPFPARAAAAIR
jgi:exopolysaccharide production protein ExoQ